MVGKSYPVTHTDAEWRKILTPEQYDVMRSHGTEAPGTCALLVEKRPGKFTCAACGQTLFRSNSKFESGTGWPSFTQPITGHIGTARDFKMILPRTEYHCARCSGHQGHVFKDGPLPRGERWCNNGVALKFVLRGAPLPALRS